MASRSPRAGRFGRERLAARANRQLDELIDSRHEGVNSVAPAIRAAMRRNGVDDVERASSSLSLTPTSPDYGRADLIIAISRPAVRSALS